MLLQGLNVLFIYCSVYGGVELKAAADRLTGFGWSFLGVSSILDVCPKGFNIPISVGYVLCTYRFLDDVS